MKRRPVDTGRRQDGQDGPGGLLHCPATDTGPVLGLPINRTDALLPADLLQGGETIILLLKPSLAFVVLSQLEYLALLAGAAALLVWAGPWLSGELGLGPRFGENAALVLAAVAMVTLFRQFLQWISEVYVLTDRRVIRVRNFFRPEVFEAALVRLQHTQLLFSVRERLFGLGSIAFSTAGTGLPEAFWLMIRRPLAVHRRIVQAIHRARNHG